DTTPTETDVPCRLNPDFAGGQQAGAIAWTHTLDLAADADVREGGGRGEGGATISYADGDEIRIGTTRYVVVWVEPHVRDGPTPFRRAYLLRHEVTWPNL
ncbi:MAG: hypothetical protein K1X57_14855, partial [Gemmataceae bacterium]|nr:hypothetical protein [Gemmataceae bacterium]